MKDEINTIKIEQFNREYAQLGNIKDERHRHELASLISAEDFDIGV